jgi:hypothetical protein
MGKGRTEDLNQPYFCGTDVVELPLVRGLGRHGHNGSQLPSQVLAGMIHDERVKCEAQGKKFMTVDKFGFGDDF